MKNQEYNKADIAASFQKAVVAVLTEHAMQACEQYHIDKLAIAGGVAANSAIRDSLKYHCEQKKIAFFCPPNILCTDNAAMIASAAYYEYDKGEQSELSLNADPNLTL